jgi:hypothetical protein
MCPGFIGQVYSHHGVIDGVRHQTPFDLLRIILKPRSKGFFKNLSVKLEAGKVCVILSLSAKETQNP